MALRPTFEASGSLRPLYEAVRQMVGRMPPCKIGVHVALADLHFTTGSVPVFGTTASSMFHQRRHPMQRNSTSVSKCQLPSSIDRYLFVKDFGTFSIQSSSDIDGKDRWFSSRAIDRGIDILREVSIPGGGGGHGARLFASRIARNGTSHATRHEAKEGCDHPDPSEVQSRRKGVCAAGLPTRQA